MNDRQDALVAAGEFIHQVAGLPKEVSNSAVATIGKMEVQPNGVNVIPGSVQLYVDIRDIYRETRDDLVDRIRDLSTQIAEKHGVIVSDKETLRVDPVPIAEATQQQLAGAFKENGLKQYKLPSGAGHDAMIVGVQLPVAMLFVQSKDGVSHNPAEWSDLSDCMQSIHVLKSFLESKQNLKMEG